MNPDACFKLIADKTHGFSGTTLVGELDAVRRRISSHRAVYVCG